VVIHDTVDISKFDLSTFSFNSFGFGDTLFYVPDEFRTEIVEDIDLRDTRGIWLRVNGKVDTLTGVIEWKFTSYDTVTFDLVSDPMIGFLPPNVSPPEGQGFISYSVKPKTSDVHGEVLYADSASIIFDTNAPIKTNDWINTIDTVKPTSAVQPLTALQTDTTFRIYVNGSDAHAGIMDYIIYASVNDSAYDVIAMGLPTDSMLFTGVDGNDYKFFSQARDLAGNIEDTVHVPDALTTIALLTGPDEKYEGYSFDVYPNPSSLSVNLFIHTQSQHAVTVTLYNMQAEKQKQWSVKVNCVEKLSLENLSAGIYYLEAITDEKKMLIRKIAIMK